MQKILLSAAVLAGGDSKRMGENKAFLELNGTRLIDLIVGKLCGLFSEVLVISDMGQEMAYLPVRVVEDVFKEGEKNALKGIHAALNAATRPSCFIIACDMPFLSLPLIKYMSSFAYNYDLVVPRLDGHYQPLFSFYRKSTLGVINRALERKQYKVSSLCDKLCDKLHVKIIDEAEVQIYDPERLSFFNINNRDDFRCAEMLQKQPH